MAVKPIPEGYHTATPYLVVRDAVKVIDFVKQAFGAGEIERMTQPDGRIAHAEVRIGDSIIMLGEPMGEQPAMPAMIYLYVADTDAAYRRAIAAGGASVMEPADQFYGDRNAGVRDAGGNLWWIATRKEDLSREELEKRAAAALKK
ncbi:MAG: VOC family protein [Bryobacteraceae bacterium]